MRRDYGEGEPTAGHGQAQPRIVPFPPLTPSELTWEAPSYEIIEHTSEDGAITPQILMDVPGKGGLVLRFDNVRDSDYEAILAAHDAAFGEFDDLGVLPPALLAGRSADLAALINTYGQTDVGLLQWAFAEPPTAEWTKKGRCNVEVRLRHRLNPFDFDYPDTTTGVTPRPTDPGIPAAVDAYSLLDCSLFIPPPQNLIGCQAFWTSRLLEPIYNGSGNVSGNSIVNDAGEIYTCHAWMPVTSNDAYYSDVFMILVKYDKDGAVLWTRKTDGGILNSGNGAEYVSPQMCFTNVGVAIAIRCNASVFWHVSSAGAQIFMRNYTQIAGTGQSWHVATQHLAYHAGNNSLYSFATQYSVMLAVRLDATTGAMANAWDPYGQGYQATPGTPGFSPIQLPDGKLLMVGTRDSAGWIAVLNQDMSRHEEYVYNGSQPFIGIISYDASNWFVVGAYSTNPSTSYFYLISKSNYSIVAAYQAVTSFGVPSHVRGLAVGPDGTVYLAYRQNMFAIIDIPNMVVRARDYGNPLWRMPIGPSSSTSTGSHEFTIPRTAQTINVTSKMVVAFYSANYSASTYGPSDAHRVLTLALGTNIPPGTYVLDTDPPLNRTMTVTVTGTTTALTTRALPVGTPIPAPDAGRAVTSLTAGTFTPNFQPVATGTFEYELQSAPICPPKFWTSRLNVPLYPGIGAPSGSTVVDDTGNSYSIMRYADAGAIDASSGILLTKRDKDGKVLWQKKTPVLPSVPVYWFSDLYLTAQGVFITVNYQSNTANIRMWHIAANGTELYGARYAYAEPVNLIDAPSQLPVYDSVRNEIIATSVNQDSKSSIASYDAATGACTRCFYTFALGIVIEAPMVQLPNGNILMAGERSGVGILMEVRNDWTAANFAASVVQAYTYPPATSFRGVCVAGNTLVAVDKGQNIYVFALGDFSLSVALKPKASPPQTGSEVRSMVVGAGGIVHVAWRSGMLWDIDIPGRVGGVRQQMISATAGAGRNWQFENTGTYGYQQQQHQAINATAKLGVAWMGHTGGTNPGNETDNFMVVGLNTDAGVGTWSMYNHPPYTDRSTVATVTSPSVILDPIALPTRTVAAPPGVTYLPSPALAPIAIEAFTDDTTFTWDLQTYKFT